MRAKILLLKFFLGMSVFAYGQWEDGVILDVQEVDIAMMNRAGLTGAESVLLVMEQFVDQSYRFVYISRIYKITEEQEAYSNRGKDKFVVGLIGYPNMNNLIYAHVLYEKKFFIVVLAKTANDIKVIDGVQMIRMNYEKKNQVRRTNVKETLQRNNIVPIGIEGR